MSSASVESRASVTRSIFGPVTVNRGVTAQTKNGLLLTPNIDHLFDSEFIGFDEKGDLLISPVADRKSLERMGANPGPVERRSFCRRTAPLPLIGIRNMCFYDRACAEKCNVRLGEAAGPRSRHSHVVSIPERTTFANRSGVRMTIAPRKGPSFIMCSRHRPREIARGTLDSYRPNRYKTLSTMEGWRLKFAPHHSSMDTHGDPQCGRSNNCSKRACEHYWRGGVCSVASILSTPQFGSGHYLRPPAQ